MVSEVCSALHPFGLACFCEGCLDGIAAASGTCHCPG
jgi:hypothetical protein